MAEKSKKKILYIITKSVWGGAGKHVYDLATSLPSMPQTKFGAIETVVAAGGQNELTQKLTAAGVPYFEIKNFQRNISFFKEIFAYFEILRLLLKTKPDIIHVNSSKAGGIAGVAVWNYKILTLNFSIKSVFTAHGWAFHENRPKWQIFLIKLFSKITCFYYSKVICVSEYDRQSAIKNHIASIQKLITIHNGIEAENYNFIERENAKKKLFEIYYRCNISQSPHMRDLTNSFGDENKDWDLNSFLGSTLIGTIGEFTKNKGQRYLIEAIKKSRVANYKLQVVIIGWGEKISNLKSQISNLGLENNIFLIENFPNAASHLKAFDIFVLPSVKEGLPYTLLEAGLAELPVIATNVGGIPEIVGHNEGLLIKPANAEQLADAIEKLAANPEERKLMAANLRQKILREFSLKKMLNATIAAYE